MLFPARYTSRVCNSAVLTASTEGYPEKSKKMSEAGSSQGVDKRKHVAFNELGQAVDAGATHFMDRLADIVKTFISVKYVSWKVVKKESPQSIDAVWDEVQCEFIVPERWKDYVVKEMPKIYRRYKNKLRTKYMDIYPTLEEQIRNPPPGVKPDDWEDFCKHEDDHVFKERRKTNKRNRSMLKYSHTGGHYSSAMIAHQLIVENPDDEIDRTKVWVKNHTRKDGSTVPGAEVYMDLVKTAAAAQASTQSENGSQTFSLSLDTDPLASVFGKDSNGRVRAVGSTISKRQCVHAAPAIAKLREQSKEKYEWKREMKTMSTQLKDLMEMMSVLAKQGGNVQHQPATPVVNGPQTDMLSVKSTHIPQSSSESQSRNCELRDMNFQVVALATLVTNDTKNVCHRYTLDTEREVKVILNKIEKPNTILYKSGLINGAETFEDIMPGGYLVWPKCCITYV